jgi:16S rRNA (cytosine967-C5)-methyltransferase
VSGEKPREIALSILSQRREGEFVEDLLERGLASAGLSSIDRGLCQELVYGVVRWQATLDWLIARKTDNRSQKPALRDLLRLGLYQVFWLDRIPDHAAVNVTVELARQRGFGPQSGFVNALLRGYLRDAEATRSELGKLKAERPAIGYSHPEWLVQRWQSRRGEAGTRQLLEWNNTPPKVYARINTIKTEAGKLLDQWRAEGVEYDFVRRDWVEENLAFELKRYPPLEKLESFQQGLFYIQDPSTLLAVEELAPRPGDTVLDLCAAPGGKLTYIAQRINNQAQLTACEVSDERSQLVARNCRRLGVVGVRLCSPADLKPSEVFDRVLLDVPCSNTGVMRRRVDLRWRISPEEVSRLSATQAALLHRGAGLVKQNGSLVYSTCSLESEENERVIEVFLKTNPQFELRRERRLDPVADGVDGAYVARLERK